jgi:hypothetical protein
MSDAVLDLDVLRPKKRIIRLCGHDIDVSFIPIAITWDLESIIRRAGQLDNKKIQESGSELKTALDLSVELCATFCTWQYPELTAEWFAKNVNAAQLQSFANVIKEVLQQAYAGVDSKNGEAVQAL